MCYFWHGATLAHFKRQFYKRYFSTTDYISTRISLPNINLSSFRGLSHSSFDVSNLSNCIYWSAAAFFNWLYQIKRDEVVATEKF